MPAEFGVGELGVLKGPEGWHYQITWDDVLWGVKMVQGEAGGNTGTHGAAVLWCMAQRLYFKRASGLSFKELIRRYSQPINPIWTDDPVEGVKCRAPAPGVPAGTFYGRDECKPERIARRWRIIRKPWEQYDESLREFVIRWARGLVNNPVSKAVEFATPKVSSQGRGLVGLQRRKLSLVWDSLGRPEGGLETEGNAFYLKKNNIGRNSQILQGGTEDWTANHVRIAFAGHTSSPVDPGNHDTAPPAAGTDTAPPRTAAQSPETERLRSLTEGRTEPPASTMGYYVLGDGSSVSEFDPNARGLVPVHDPSIKSPSDSFFLQVNALKNVSNVDYALSVPLLQVSARDENDDFVNLNELIFGKPTFHNIFEAAATRNTHYSHLERPLASLEGLQITVQPPSAGGAASITMATLSIKIHNFEMVNANHPSGKFLAWMMRPGYHLRLRYGVQCLATTAIANSLRDAFQWIEDDFFVNQHTLSVEDDKSVSLKVSLQPTHSKLFNQIYVGESLPMEEIGQITREDLLSVLQSVTGQAPAEQVKILDQALKEFAQHFNTSITSAGLRTQVRSDGTLGSTFREALTNSQIINQPDQYPETIMENVVEGLQSIQSFLLTRRYTSLMKHNSFNYTNKGISYIAVKYGAIFHHLLRPEIERVATIATTSDTELPVGRLTSLDAAAIAQGRGNRVKIIFGNFNSRAGKWADKPVSNFPVNMDTIFSFLRDEREVGQFSDTLNNFISKLNTAVREPSNFTVTPEEIPASQRALLTEQQLRAATTSYPLQVPELKFVFYANPVQDAEADWIFYVYDSKDVSVRFHTLFDALNEHGDGVTPPTADQIKEKCLQLNIPWIEMGATSSFIRSMSADTTGNDLIQSHLMSQANLQNITQRQLDAATVARQLPAGISREFLDGRQTFTSDQQAAIRNTMVLMPLRVSLDCFMISSAVLFSPIYIFFPLKQFSALYQPYELGHEIQNGQAFTKITLQIQTSQANIAPA